MIPGRKGSISTSAVEHNLRTMERPCGFFRSKAMDLLPLPRRSNGGALGCGVETVLIALQRK